MPTNAYATSTTPVELTTDLLGQPVRVRATPVAWSFDYGDGTVVGPTQDPGGPYPELSMGPGVAAMTTASHFAVNVWLKSPARVAEAKVG